LFKYFLNSKSQLQLLTLIPLGILFGILVWLQKFTFHTSTSDGILFNFILSFIEESLLMGKIITYVSVVGSGFLFNEIFKSYSILPRRNYTLLLIWMILVVAFPTLWSLSSQLLAFTMVIYAFFLLYRAALEDFQIRDLITVSFLFSIASLIYRPFIGYLLFLPIALVVLRQFNFKFFLIILIIFSIPYFYLWVYFLFFGEPLTIFTLFDFNIFHPALNIDLFKDYHFAVPLVMTGFLFLYSFVKTIGSLAKKLIQIRTILTLTIAYFFFTIFLISVSPSDIGFNIYLLMAPASGIIAVGLLELKPTWLLDVYLALIIFSSVLLTFF